MTISILVATRGREASLNRLIESVAEALTDDIECDVVVVENGSENSEQLVRRHRGSVNIQYLHQSAGSKSMALNKGLQICKGEIIAFTDDDVIVSRAWISRIGRAARTYQSAVVFCGPIRVAYPDKVPAWMQSHAYALISFAHFTPDLPEGPLPRTMSPLGPNFSVRKAAIKGMHFREDLGPSDVNGPLMCEDVAFLDELRDRYHPFVRSGAFIFIPDATVTHCITDERATLSYLSARFFQLGRSHIIRFRRITALGTPWRLLEAYSPSTVEEQFSTAMELNFLCGQLAQSRCDGNDSRTVFLRETLRRMRIEEYTQLLCEEAANAL